MIDPVVVIDGDVVWKTEVWYHNPVFTIAKITSAIYYREGCVMMFHRTWPNRMLTCSAEHTALNHNVQGTDAALMQLKNLPGEGYGRGVVHSKAK